MGTCNFWTMDDFDLYVIDDETLVRNYLGDDFVNEEIESYDIDLAWDMLLGD
jgi:hypothetical protein